MSRLCWPDMARRGARRARPSSSSDGTMEESQLCYRAAHQYTLHRGMAPGSLIHTRVRDLTTKLSLFFGGLLTLRLTAPTEWGSLSSLPGFFHRDQVCTGPPYGGALFLFFLPGLQF